MISRDMVTIGSEFLMDPSRGNKRETASVEAEVLSLQLAQFRHDRFYHADIALLPVVERMKHFTLHMAKYVGHLAEAIDRGEDTLLRRTLIDTFIISLASANTLQLNLGKALNSAGRLPTGNLNDLGVTLARLQSTAARDPSWLLRTMAHHVGKLAKACESLDHLEDYPYRAQMLDTTREIFELVLIAAAAREIPVVKEAAARIHGIETKHLFHDLHE